VPIRTAPRTGPAGRSRFGPGPSDPRARVGARPSPERSRTIGHTHWCQIAVSARSATTSCESPR
jgi:hypothetical protein